MTDFTKLDDYTLKATNSLSNDWGAPRLSRIFNFKAQQVTTLYERGGLKDFEIPDAHYGTKTGYTAAVAGAIQIQNFRDIENDAEIAEMHAKLVELKGAPPALEDILPRLGKKPATLKQ